VTAACNVAAPHGQLRPQLVRPPPTIIVVLRLRCSGDQHNTHVPTHLSDAVAVEAGFALNPKRTKRRTVRKRRELQKTRGKHHTSSQGRLPLRPTHAPTALPLREVPPAIAAARSVRSASPRPSPGLPSIPAHHLQSANTAPHSGDSSLWAPVLHIRGGCLSAL
jgi:hypothetical protein